MPTRNAGCCKLDQPERGMQASSLRFPTNFVRSSLCSRPLAISARAAKHHYAIPNWTLPLEYTAKLRVT